VSMVENFLKEACNKMQDSIEYFKNELKAIRTGRATPSLVEKIEIEYYRAKTPLVQVAAITTPDSKTILIQPWDKSLLAEIEKAISGSSLGVSPINDGNSIIVKVPPLTEEARINLIRLVNEQKEKAKVALRNIRHDIFDQVKKAEKEKKVSEDDLYYSKEELDKIVKEFEEEVDNLARAKEEEIREI